MSAGAPPSPDAAGRGSSLRVLWTVAEFRIGSRATWGKEEAAQMLFKPLDIDATTITFAGTACTDVLFQKETVDLKEYLDSTYHTTPQALGIADETAEVVKTNCSLRGFSEYLRLQDRRIVINVNGVFFFFTPAVNY